MVALEWSLKGHVEISEAGGGRMLQAERTVWQRQILRE